MMLRKIVALLFFTSVLSLRAQVTQVYSDPLAIYNRGLELYDKEKFAAAIPEFEAYLEQGKEFELLINSRFYIAFCHMALDHKDAEQQILNLLEEHSDHPKANYARFRLGHYYYNKNNTGNSLKYLEETKAENLSEEDRKTYYFLYGYGLFTKEKYKEAREQFRRIEKNKDKYYYPTNYYLGYMSMVEDKDDDALAYFFKVSASKVYGDKVPVYIARIYYRMGSYKEVISYTDTISGLPNQHELSWERGKAYYQLAEYQTAINNFGNVRATRDMSSEDLYMVGMSHYHLGDCEKAFPYLTAITGEKNPLRQSALMHAGDCFIKLEKKANARNAFFEASRLDTDKELQELASFNYAKLSLEPPFQNEAVGALSKFIDTYPNSQYGDEAKGYLGEALLQAKKYADAIPVIESIKNKNDKIKATYQQICFFYASELLRQDPAAAKTYFEKAQTYPVDGKLDAQVNFWMGELYFNEGKIAYAQASWERFLAHPQAPETPVYLDGLYNLGYAYFNQKEYERALGRFKMYTDKESYGGEKRVKYLDGMTRLADCYYIGKNFKKAIEAYSYVTSKEAVNSDYAWFQIGMIHGILNHREDKLVTMKRIPSLYPNSEYVDDALFQVALVELERQNYPEAMRGFSFLLEDYPNGIYAKRSYLNRGLVYHNMKQDENALTDLKHVVENFPKNEDTEVAIELVKDIYNEAGRGKELIDWLNKINVYITVSYQDSTIYYSALKHYKGEKWTLAASELQDYLKRFPSGQFVTQAHFYRAESLYTLNEYEKSLEGYLFNVDKKFPDFLERSLRRVAAIYLWQQKTDASIPYLKQLENTASGKDDILYAQVNLMYGLYALDNLEEAKTYAEKVLANAKAQSSEKTDANLIMGRVLVENGELEKARTYFEKVEKQKENKNAKGAEAKYYLCYIALKNNDYKKTQALVYELNEKYANQEYWVARAFNLMAESLIAEKDYFNARAVLNNILGSYPIADDGVKEESQKLLDRATQLENSGSGK